MILARAVDLPVRRCTVRTPAWAPWSGAVAAALVLGLSVGKGRPAQGVVRARDGQLYAAGSAAGSLANALDR